ncbi:MAG: hypothetical protein NTX49_05805 [Chlamydiae bacterium]|nr:hypothetical protein [Chlamydiota bacterium]
MAAVYTRNPPLGATSSLPTYTSLVPLNPVTERTKTLWERFKLFVGGLLRDTFFWVLHSRLSEQQNIQLEQENAFFRDFWNRSAPFSPRWPQRNEIISTFTHKKISLDLHSPKRLEVDCCTIETQAEEPTRPYYNFALAMGNLSTIRNNITGIYPFISAYLAKRRADPSLPPARFILISQYDLRQGVTPYKPETIDEAGQILSSTLSSLQDKYGPINQLAAHSLGTIVTGAALKYIDRTRLPRHMYFDRGPSSIQEICRSKLGGSILYPLASVLGWDIDLGKEVAEFHRSCEIPPSIVISNVKKDHHFVDTAALSRSSHIERLAAESKLEVMEFDFPGQDLHETAQHNIGNDQLYGHYLLPRAVEERRLPLGRAESMAQAIVERSLLTS